MLEYYPICPKCSASVVGIAVPPFSWFQWLFGIKCKECGYIIDVKNKDDIKYD